MLPVKLAKAVVLPLVLSIGLFGFAVADDNVISKRSISVTGVGDASAVPDQATVNAGVMTHAATVIEATKENQAIAERILKALIAQGIEEKDIQTVDYAIWPEQRRDPRNNDESVITGYRVNNTVRIVVKNIDILGEVLAAVTNAGANTINGINFGIEDSQVLAVQARAAAMADALSKAQALAQLAGVQLGEVLQISMSSGGGSPMPASMVRLSMAESAPAPSISAGQLNVAAQVQVQYAIR